MPATAGPVAPGSICRATSTLAIPLPTSSAIALTPIFFVVVAQQIRRADVAAAGQAQIDAAMAASQQVRERDRSEQIPDAQGDDRC